jgi:putative hydrolase of the HAD superfamily
MRFADRDIDAWVFDLDNTLYTESSALFDVVGARMTDYVARLTGLDTPQAEALQERYHLNYGATVVGLVRHHGVAARDFLDYVHDIDLTIIPPNPAVREAILALPGRSYVYTNGAGAYARALLAHLDLADLFTEIVDIERVGLAPKPERGSFERFLALTGIDTARAAMFEDTPRNLETAKALGFETVLVRHAEGGDHRRMTTPPYVDHVTWDLPAFLQAIRLSLGDVDAA